MRTPTRSTTRRALLAGLCLLSACGESAAAAGAAAAGAVASKEGVLLRDALRDLQSQGLRLFFSSELVTAEMRVAAGPASRDPKRQAEQWLRPHGLRLEPGPRGSLLVVRAPRPWAVVAQAPERPQLRVTLHAPPGSVLRGLPVQLNGRALGITLSEDLDVALGEQELGAYVVAARTPELEGEAHVRIENGVQDVPLPLVARRVTSASEGVGATLDLTLTAAAELSESIQVQSGVVLFGDTQASLRVQPSDLRGLAGGAESALMATQTLPGVVGLGPLDPRFVVRGGDPDQNLMLVDGIEMHNLFPFTLIVNPFDADTVEQLELFTSGLPARYGDRLSSALVLETRPGTSEHWLSGRLGLSVLEGALSLEGRVPGLEHASWLFSGQGFNFRILGEVWGADDVATFADRQLHFDWLPRPGQRLSVHALRARTPFKDASNPTSQQALGARWRSTAGTRLAWGARFGVYSTIDDGSAGPWPFVAPHSAFDDTHGFESSRRLDLRDVSSALDVSLLSRRHLLSAGIETHALKTSLDWTTPWYLVGARIPQTESARTDVARRLTTRFDRVRAAAWVEDHLQLAARVSVTAGLRAEHSGVREGVLIDPRVAAALALDPRSRLLLTLGQRHQSPGFEKLIQRDDTIHTPRIGDVPGVVDPTALPTLPSEQARQLSLGLERTLGAGFGLRVEAYARHFDHLIYPQLESEAERLARLARYDFPPELQAELPPAALLTERAASDGLGRARGVEVTLTRPAAREGQHLSGWASYTWSHASRRFANVWMPSVYDRPHALTAAAHVAFDERWELSASGWLASGLPRHAPAGLRVAGVQDRQDIDGDGILSELVPVPAGSGSGWLQVVAPPPFTDGLPLRLPALVRLDVRLNWRPKGRRGRWTVYVDEFNVFNNNSPFGVAAHPAADSATGALAVQEDLTGGMDTLTVIGVRFRF